MTEKKVAWRWHRAHVSLLTGQVVQCGHWLHDCPHRREQLVISPRIAETTGCPDCGDKPAWHRRIATEVA